MLDFAQMMSRPLHGSISDEVVRDALQDLSASDQQLLLLVAREPVIAAIDITHPEIARVLP